MCVPLVDALRTIQRTPPLKFARRSSTFGSVDGPDSPFQAEPEMVRLDSRSTSRRRGRGSSRAAQSANRGAVGRRSSLNGSEATNPSAGTGVAVRSSTTNVADSKEQ